MFSTIQVTIFYSQYSIKKIDDKKSIKSESIKQQSHITIY